ncbi:DUF3800 domain-containing protein [Brevibacillus laterosporus]|uniref:DUF3800 domain-containing protein n=1 Tax=Brevibacillus laterosporus TaxID=1465 RepID=UPI001443E3D3|nr:DUF3800 domain-containing protein [Brevibacillus laterosporus]NKQ20712.1 DUF3800 domain-containing protein [Brevibacillus laterosporus]WNX29679.1 DUF3800 domain-containing protein [Brevibacillus laterosporus]
MTINTTPDDEILVSEQKDETYSEEKEISDQEKKKIEKRKKEKTRLISNLAQGNLDNLITRVAFVLNHFPETRNSDITLQIRYWETFQSDIYKGSIDPKVMYMLERQTSLARARAKIQNEYKLFLANEKIRNFRRNKQETEKEIQLATKPEIPLISIYCDESGKTGNYAIVGSVWIIDKTRQAEIRNYFINWKQEKGLSTKDEFHFTEMKKHQLDLYKEFFAEVIKNSDAIGFKAVVVDKTKIRRPIDEIIMDLHYQVVHQGIEHEVINGRVALPRIVNFFKDEEDGQDALYETKLQQHLHSQFRLAFDDQLTLDIFSSVASFQNVFIQMADLYTGCLSRILNHQKQGEGNHKDKFTDYVLELLGLDLSIKDNQRQDFAMVYFFE